MQDFVNSYFFFRFYFLKNIRTTSGAWEEIRMENLAPQTATNLLEILVSAVTLHPPRINMHFLRE